ncbi:hypothetical protein J4Q44_G00286000 [Coregonus suidteri]|uniref:RNA helicase n=1 Tax=Coregonus suidteri TaxID=861788 RepID=A0AAN8QSZ7_9TELE
MLQVEFLSQTQVEIPQEVREVMDSLLDKVADGEAQEKKAEVFKANLIPYPSSSSAVNVMKVLESQVDKEKKVEVLDLSTCPILQTALTDIETTMKTAYKTMPKQIVVLGSTIKHIITQVLLQVDPQAFQEGVYLETPVIINNTKALLWSIPWVQVTEDEEMSNTQQSIDAYEVAKAVINNLEEVVIFVKSVQRCVALSQLLVEQNFPAIAIHRGMAQEERLSRYQQFKDFQRRILVATNLFGRGMDIERVNIVFNYDMPEDSDTYLHRVARAGRFGTKGLAVTFVSDETDAKTLNDVQDRFEVNVAELPEEIDISTYIEQSR